MDWVRLWLDMPNDPKWRAIARRSGRSVSEVIAVYTHMLCQARKSDTPGTLDAWDDEDVGAALDVDAEAVTAIREAMQGKVLDGERLTGWEKRQPKREDSSTERVRKHREAKATQAKRDETQRNAPDTETDTDTDNSDPNGSGDVAAFDPAKQVFADGVKLLTAAGVKERSARAKLGQWRRDHGDVPLLNALAEARENGAVEPIAYVERTLRNQAQTSEMQTKEFWEKVLASQ